MEVLSPAFGTIKAPVVEADAKPRAGASPFAPSIVVPLQFVLTGVAALCLAVGALVWRPEILATYHYNQYVIAVTHLLVLGWIISVVTGALYQLAPVALETQLHSEKLARWQFLFHIVGVSGMVWMFWRWDLKQVGHFGCVFVTGTGLLVWNLARTLRKVKQWNVVAFSIVSALAWLSVAVLVGLSVAAGKCTYDSAPAWANQGVMGGLLRGVRSAGTFAARFDQLGAMHAHAHLGGIGVFVMLITGVSYKLVPMFALSEIRSRLRAGLSIALLNLGLAGSFVAILLRSPLKIVFCAVAVCGLATYGWEMRAILRARKRRTLDWGLKYFLTAIALLGPLSLLALVLSWPGLPLNVLTGQLENLYGFAALVGVVSLAILGMLYKIVPFLVWYGVYSSRIGSQKVPSLGDLCSARVQAWGYWTYLAGVLVTGAAIVAGHATGVRCGSMLLAVSLLLFVVNLGKILSHFWRPSIQPVGQPATATAL